MAASFKAMSRRLGHTLKQVATQRSWGILGALLGATVGSVMLRRTRAASLEPIPHPSDSFQPKALAPTLPTELVPAPTREMTPPHGDPLARSVGKAPRKKRSRPQASSTPKRSTQARDMSDAEEALEASAASVSEREPALLPPPVAAKGSKRARSTHAPRRGRSHPSK